MRLREVAKFSLANKVFKIHEGTMLHVLTHSLVLLRVSSLSRSFRRLFFCRLSAFRYCIKVEWSDLSFQINHNIHKSTGSKTREKMHTSIHALGMRKLEYKIDTNTVYELQSDSDFFFLLNGYFFFPVTAKENKGTFTFYSLFLMFQHFNSQTMTWGVKYFFLNLKFCFFHEFRRVKPNLTTYHDLYIYKTLPNY